MQSPSSDQGQSLHRKKSVAETVMVQKRSNDTEKLQRYNSKTLHFDKDLEEKVEKATTGLSDNLLLLANEPSVGLYRIQEHVHRSVPLFRTKCVTLEETVNDIEGLVFDMDYASENVKDLGNCMERFSSIDDIFREAIAHKQKINEFQRIKSLNDI